MTISECKKCITFGKVLAAAECFHDAMVRTDGKLGREAEKIYERMKTLAYKMHDELLPFSED